MKFIEQTSKFRGRKKRKRKKIVEVKNWRSGICYANMDLLIYKMFPVASIPNYRQCLVMIWNPLEYTRVQTVECLKPSQNYDHYRLFCTGILQYGISTVCRFLFSRKLWVSQRLSSSEWPLFKFFIMVDKVLVKGRCKYKPVSLGCSTFCFTLGLPMSLVFV